MGQGLVKQEEINMNLPIFPLDESQIDLKLLTDYPPEKICRKFGFIPVSRTDIYMTCASALPWTEARIDSIRALHYDSIRPISISEPNFAGLLQYICNANAKSEKKSGGIAISNERGRPNARVCLKNMLKEAYTLGASDIHIEPQESRVSIKFRINGQLCIQEPIHKADSKSFVAAVKELASLPASETKNLADCRFSYNLDGKSIDFRVAKLPASRKYENFVLRILDSEKASKMKLPFVDKELETFQKCLNATSGMIILTGPTGSGKTTTLYSALGSLDLTSLNVRTIEDPIEYRLSKVIQTQIDVPNGVTFANTLRSMLRADPDVIMVGEIRDPETAELAAAASNTGHLVLSTLHTKSAVGTISRLKDLGLSPYEIQEAVSLVVSQRLLPKLCDCKIPRGLSESEKGYFLGAGINVPEAVYEKNGCIKCANTGFISRVPIFEFFQFTPEIKELIASNAPMGSISEENGKRFQTLGVSAIKTVSKGLCPPEVIYDFGDTIL